MVDLNPGDYIYQSDQELFLVVIDETEDSYVFAAHGWRDIDKDRLDQYIQDSHSKVHSQDEVESMIDDEGGDKTQQQFNKLKQLFAVYEKADIPGEGAHTDFALEEK